MYEYTLTFKELDYKIRKGDKFVCISDGRMRGYVGDLAYITGKIYTSEQDDCITDEQGYKNHSWDYRPGDKVRWEEVFQRYEEKCCGRCNGVDDKCISDRPDKDYFQSMKEEYGKRTFDTGAVRDSNEGKSRPDLISPYFTERLGFRLAEGAKKYEENNWKKGIPDEAFLESLERHLVAYKMGKTDEDHLSALAFNCMGIIHNQEVRKLNKK